MAIDYAKLGARIKYYRNKKKMSQEALAEMVSVNHEHISRIEGGHIHLSLTVLVAIANSLDVSVDDLLVDSLTHPTSNTGDAIHTLLLDCNDSEEKILTKTLTTLKALLSEFGI